MRAVHRAWVGRLMSWAVEIRKHQGEVQSTVVSSKLLSDAVEDALDEFSLIHEEEGNWQITASRLRDEEPRRADGVPLANKPSWPFGEESI